MVLLLLAGFSLLQYLTGGAVTWPGDLYRYIRETVSDRAAGPDAAWRRATDVLEDLGSAREGLPVPAFDLSGRVVRVADGDTISLLDEHNTQYKVRLYGIDTPEQDQPHGRTAKSALAELVDERQVGLVVVETDEYGRKVATLYREDTNINLVMVSEGHAWWYRYYAPHEHALARAERQARERRLGLWAQPEPVPPWDWRRGRR